MNVIWSCIYFKWHVLTFFLFQKTIFPSLWIKFVWPISCMIIIILIHLFHKIIFLKKKKKFNDIFYIYIYYKNIIYCAIKFLYTILNQSIEKTKLTIQIFFLKIFNFCIKNTFSIHLDNMDPNLTWHPVYGIIFLSMYILITWYSDK